jgi:hypothetical protein
MLKRIDDVMEEFAQMDSAGHQMIEPSPTHDDAELLAKALVQEPAKTLPRVVNHN